MAISNSGFWIFSEQEMLQMHHFDEGICKNIFDLLKNEYHDKKPKIADLGCGRCDYINRLMDCSYDVVGIEGNPNSKKFCTDSNKIFIEDLTKDISLSQEFDVVICLEVGEHIPKEFEDKLTNNINKILKPNGHLILSWAIENQGGYGHVNCRSNSYIRSVFNEYSSLIDYEEKFRKDAKLPWFKSTCMVFKKAVLKTSGISNESV